METTWFKLKKAFEYTVVGARGRPLYRFAKGRPQAVSIPEDVRKLRGMRDHFIECDAEGSPVTPAGGPAHVIARPKPLSSRAFQARPALPARGPSHRPAAAEQVTRPRPPEQAVPRTGEVSTATPEGETPDAMGSASPPEANPALPSEVTLDIAAPKEDGANPERPANPDLPFACPDCGKRFKSEQALGSHRRMAHDLPTPLGRQAGGK